jgi:hypothetical protein
MRIVMLLTVAVAVAVNTPTSGADREDDDVDRELVEMVVAGHLSTIQTISRYHAKVELTAEANLAGERVVVPPQEAEYWRTDEDYRIRALDAVGRIVQVERKAGNVRILAYRPTETFSDRRARPSLIVGDRHRRAIDLDPWELSLFSLPVGIYTRPPMVVYDMESLTGTGTVREAAWVEESGRERIYVRVDLPEERRAYEIWAAPEYNWALVKVIHTTYEESGTLAWHREYTCEEFIECEPTIFVPTKASIRSEFGGHTYSGTATFSEILLNEACPRPPRFELPRSGLTVVDEAAHTIYEIDGAGRRSGDVVPLAGTIIPPSPAERSGDGRATLGYILIAFSTAFLFAGWAFKKLRATPVA